MYMYICVYILYIDMYIYIYICTYIYIYIYIYIQFWLVVWNIPYVFNSLGIVIPTDELIFFIVQVLEPVTSLGCLG